MPAIRGEEELVQVSQQQLLGAPREGCQVPGVRQGRGNDLRLPSALPSTEKVMLAREQLQLPSKGKFTLGEKTHSKERGPSPHLKLGWPVELGWVSLGPWEGCWGCSTL